MRIADPLRRVAPSILRAPEVIALCLTLLAGSAQGADALIPQEGAGDPGALWGRVVTTEGATLEGFLRWDRNETHAADLLDGSREVSREGLEARREVADASPEDRRRSVEVMGYRVTWLEDEEFDAAVRSGIRFGWVERLIPDGDGAELRLRGGESVRLSSTSTDLGPGLRGIEVRGPDGSVTTLEWGDIEVVDFLEAPSTAGAAARRLHGTVETESGLRFTGWVAWDADEVFEEEELDGEEGSVRFGDIASIERSPGGARVTLRSGEQRTLSGTNDVDRGNRGIHVSDPALGRAQVPWSEFRAFTFHAPERAEVAFDGGGPLFGTVGTESGREIEGRVIWDLDEGAGWQLLDGTADGVDVAVEFSRIRSIEKARGGEGARVTLRDGRSWLLEDSNDVNATNRGILVIDGAGERHFVDWVGFARLDLEAR